MIVNIFTVLRKGTITFQTPKVQLYNLSRVGAPAAVTNYTTQLLYNGTLLATPAQGILVNGALGTIQASLAGTVDPNASVTRTPDRVNGSANTTPRTIRTSELLYAEQDGGNVIWYVINPNNALVQYTYQFNSTTLEAEMVYWNNVSDNIDFTGTFGACTSSTQAFTYNVNQAVTLRLQVQTGEGWVTINTNTVSVSAGTAVISFNFETADLVLNDVMRVIAVKADGTVIPIVSKQFTCTGGSASGSGTPTDCGEYAYFDGARWNNTYRELNLGATCTTGYNVQVATGSDFGAGKIVYDIETQSTLVQLSDIAAGTYYARVANLAGVTNFSAVLTFVVS